MSLSLPSLLWPEPRLLHALWKAAQRLRPSRSHSGAFSHEYAAPCLQQPTSAGRGGSKGQLSSGPACLVPKDAGTGVISPRWFMSHIFNPRCEMAAWETRPVTRPVCPVACPALQPALASPSGWIPGGFAASQGLPGLCSRSTGIVSFLRHREGSF